MGLSSVEPLLGDLYAQVAGMRFDLVTANPPFVPAPSQEVGFRDGGPTGEDVQRRIVRRPASPPRQSRGIAQMVTELGEARRREPGAAPPASGWATPAWTSMSFASRTHSAQAYAVGHATGDDTQAVLESVDRWAQNLAAQGYDRVVSVLLAFQWSDDPWFREDEAQPPTADAGREIEAIFAAERLSREPTLKERLRAGTVVRTAPLALVETRGLGVDAPVVVQARPLGPSIGIEHVLQPIEREVLMCMESPIATTELLSAAAKASVPEDAVLSAMVALVRKGIIRTEG